MWLRIPDLRSAPSPTAGVLIRGGRWKETQRRGHGRATAGMVQVIESQSTTTCQRTTTYGQGEQPPPSETTDRCCFGQLVTAITGHSSSEGTGSCCLCRREGACTSSSQAADRPITVLWTEGLRMWLNEPDPWELSGKKGKPGALQEVEGSGRCGGPWWPSVFVLNKGTAARVELFHARCTFVPT